MPSMDEVFRAPQQPVIGVAGARSTVDVCKQLAPDRFDIDGRELVLPMHIADLTMFAQVFSVKASAARELLAPAGLSPVEIFPTQSALTLMGVQYRDNPLGNYNEAVISIPAYTKDQTPRFGAGFLGGLDIVRKRAAHYVHVMPVDQEFTTHAGRFMWGYPKFLAQLTLQYAHERVSLAFAHDHEPVFSLEAPLRESGTLSYTGHTLTFHDGRLRRIEATLEARGVMFRLGGSVPEIGERHALAQTLRKLGLPKRPLATLSLRHASVDLGVAEDL
jgi:hypothetical protein